MVHVQDGPGVAEACGPVPAEQRLSAMGRKAPSVGMSTDEGQQGSQGDRGASALGCFCSHLCRKTLRNRGGLKVSSRIWEIICCPGHITSSSGDRQKPVAFKPKFDVVPEIFLQLLIQ